MPIYKFKAKMKSEKIIVLKSKKDYSLII